MLFAAVMTHIEGRKEDDLLHTYGFGGFPSLALLDAKGEVMTKKLPRDAAGMASTVTAACELVDMEAKQAAGEEVDANALFLAKLALGKYDSEQAKEQLAALKLDATQKATAGQKILVLELEEMMGELRKSRGDEAVEADCQSRIYASYKAGSRLPADSQWVSFFEPMALAGAKEAEDGAVFIALYPNVKAGLEKNLKNIDEKMKEFADNQKALDYFEGKKVTVNKQLDELNADFAKFDKPAGSDSEESGSAD